MNRAHQFLQLNKEISGMHVSRSPADPAQRFSQHTQNAMFLLQSRWTKDGIAIATGKELQGVRLQTQCKWSTSSNSEKMGTMLLDTALLKRSLKPSSAHCTTHPACSLGGDSCSHSSQPDLLWPWHKAAS